MEEQTTTQQREMIELTFNSKGVGWKMRVLGDEKVSELDIIRLEILDKELKEKFPNYIKPEETKPKGKSKTNLDTISIPELKELIREEIRINGGYPQLNN